MSIATIATYTDPRKNLEYVKNGSIMEMRINKVMIQQSLSIAGAQLLSATTGNRLVRTR